MGQLLKLLIKFCHEVFTHLVKFFSIMSFKEVTVAGIIIGIILLGVFAATKR